jgi:quercetin dioxygenase-like cupin family protein
MIVRNVSDVKPFDTSTDGQIGRVMLGPKEGTPTFVMRVFEFQWPGIQYGPETEDWEFQVLILSGKGVAIGPGGEEVEVIPMSFIYVAPNEEFGLRSTGTDTFRFMCTVPLRGNSYNDYD